MQATYARYLVLIAICLLGSAVYFAVGEPVSAGAPRWPRDESVYAASTWQMGPLNAGEGTNNTAQATRVYRSPGGKLATLTIFSNQAPKLYGAGAEVPFLGNGYVVEPLPTVAADSGIHGLVARRGDEQWLVVYAYGERRGMIGNGPIAWTLALADGVLGRSNDYYKLYLAARVDDLDSSAARDVQALAASVFPRIASYYAQAG
jgi:hypothetical protein